MVHYTSAQPTVSDWERDISNTDSGNAYIPEAPDLRVAVPKAEYQKIYLRHAEGEPQAKIAADYKVSQQALSGGPAGPLYALTGSWRP